jgi:hypothetical protein
MRDGGYVVGVRVRVRAKMIVRVTAKMIVRVTAKMIVRV